MTKFYVTLAKPSLVLSSSNCPYAYAYAMIKIGGANVLRKVTDFDHSGAHWSNVGVVIKSGCFKKFDKPICIERESTHRDDSEYS